MEDELRKRRHNFVSGPFFSDTPEDISIKERQNRTLLAVIEDCEVRYHQLLNHQNAPKEIQDFGDKRDVVVAYLMFRCFEYAQECLRVATIYGLTPLVRRLYEHMVKIHWAILNPEHCTQMAEAWRYEYLRKHFIRWDKDIPYREGCKNRATSEQIRQLRKEYEGWKGCTKLTSFAEMARIAQLEELSPTFLYGLLSNRAHGSDWEEFHITNTAASELNHLLGVGRIFFEISMDAVEDFVIWRKSPDVTGYAERLIFPK